MGGYTGVAGSAATNGIPVVVKQLFRPTIPFRINCATVDISAVTLYIRLCGVALAILKIDKMSDADRTAIQCVTVSLIYFVPSWLQRFDFINVIFFPNPAVVFMFDRVPFYFKLSKYLFVSNGV